MSDQTPYNFTRDELAAALDQGREQWTGPDTSDLGVLFGEAGPLMAATVEGQGDNPVTFCMGVLVGLKLAEKYKAALEKIALPLDDPDAIQNTRQDWDGDEMTLLDRAEKMQALARGMLE